MRKLKYEHSTLYKCINSRLPRIIKYLLINAIKLAWLRQSVKILKRCKPHQIILSVIYASNGNLISNLNMRMSIINKIDTYIIPQSSSGVTIYNL